MDEYAKSIIPIIEANYESYTETERHIADYFLNRARPERLSAELVAKELSVSPASLSRFAKKSGFHGYREFTYEFRNSYVEKSAVEQQQSKLVLDTYQNLLNKCIQPVRRRTDWQDCQGFKMGEESVYLRTRKLGTCSGGDGDKIPLDWYRSDSASG